MQLQPFQCLYGSLYLRLVQLWPEAYDSRIVNMVYLLMGMWGARSVQSGWMAAHVPVVAKKMSIVRRLEWFLSNGAVRVVAWAWVRTSRGHSSAAKQISLLSYVRELIPDSIHVSMVEDCELGHTAVLEAMHAWHWDYALRQSGHLLVQLPKTDRWVRLDSLLAQRGDWRFIPGSNSPPLTGLPRI